MGPVFDRMTRWATRLTLAVCLLFLAFLAGCGGADPNGKATTTSSANTLPLLGVFRTPAGEEFEFQAGGRCLTAKGSCTFSVDGKTVRLVLRSGEQRAFEWIEPDVLRFESAGKEPLLLYRERSAAAQRPEAQARRKTPEPPALPEPDPTTPLTDYVTVATQQDLDLLFAAHASALTDADKLALIPTPAPADAFAQRDFLAEHWPAVEARIQPMRTRYIRFDMRAPSPAEKGGAGLGWLPDVARQGVSLDPYDLQARRFPLSPCLGMLSVIGSQSLRLNAPGGATSLCAVPVADEATARTIESRRSQKPGAFFVTAEVYAFIQTLDVGRAQARITHLRLSLFSDRWATQPLVVADLL